MDNKENIKYYILPCEDDSWAKKKLILTQISLKEYKNYDEFSDLFEKTYYGYQDLFNNTFKVYFNLLDDNDKVNILEKVLPYIASKAMLIEQLFINIKIPISTQQTSSVLRLTKEQCLCLTSLMFFCMVIPPVNPQRKFHPTYNFKAILLWKGPNQIENIKCIMCYFNAMMQYEQTDKSVLSQEILFKRLVLNSNRSETDQKFWVNLEEELCEVEVLKEGLIEDFDKPSIIIDFANKYLGGFLLKGTFTQEDILFGIYPECIPSYLFTEYMIDNEAFLIQGIERFCKYEGYETTFKFKEKYNDNNIVSSNLRDSSIVAIDALNFYEQKVEEFSMKALLREINKAYIGFNADGFDGNTKFISTGKWGCGAFGGNVQLKFLIQWIACSHAKRKMVFHYKSDNRVEKIDSLYSVLRKYKVSDLAKFLFDNILYLKKKNIFLELLNKFK